MKNTRQQSFKEVLMSLVNIFSLIIQKLKTELMLFILGLAIIILLSVALGVNIEMISLIIAGILLLTCIYIIIKVRDFKKIVVACVFIGLMITIFLGFNVVQQIISTKKNITNYPGKDTISLERNDLIKQPVITPTTTKHISENNNNITNENGVGTYKYTGKVIRKNTTSDTFVFINTGKWGGNFFDFATDMDGNNREQIDLVNVKQIDFEGSSKFIDNHGTFIKNIWIKAKITLNNGKILKNVFLNITGMNGDWQWFYKTDTYGSYIDENVSSITFEKK